MDTKIVDIGIDLLENPNKKKRKDLAFFNIIEEDDKIKKNIIPDEFICPLSNELMKDPVLIYDGTVYERSEIIKWYENNDNHPLNSKKVGKDEKKIIIPDINLKKLINRNYLCYEKDSLNENLITLIREKLYNKTSILKGEKEEILDNLLASLIKLLKCNIKNDYPCE